MHARRIRFGLLALGCFASCETIAQPASPGNTLRAAKSATLDLTWAAVPGATSYNVKRCDIAAAGCAPGVIIASVAVNRVSLPLGGSHVYMIEAVDATGVSAPSNAAYQLVKTLKAPVPGVHDGTNWVSLPYFNDFASQDAAGLWAELPAERAQVYRYDPASSSLQRYAGGGLGQVNFPLTAGEAYNVAVSADINWTIVGSHDDSRAISLKTDVAGVHDGDNWVSLPYHTKDVHASDLFAELPTASRRFIYRYNPATSSYQRYPYDFGGVNFLITPGEAYLITVYSDTLWTPNHYSVSPAPPEVSGTGFTAQKLGKGSAADSVVLTFENKTGVLGYNVYEGNLGSMYSHGGAPGNVCNVATSPAAGGRLSTPAAGIGTPGSHYYLVTAFSAAFESISGQDSSGAEIAPAMNTCPP